MASLRFDVARVAGLMLAEKIDGVSLNDIVGGGHPVKNGNEFCSFLLSQGLITSDSRVLEIGCGCGRVAAPLRNILGGQGRYVGVDIIPGLIEFCRREISAANFEFYVSTESNPLYEKYIQKHALPTASLGSVAGPFDLIFAASVFTHIQPPDAREMLMTCREKLAVNGAAVLTFFVLDNFAKQRIAAGLSEVFGAVGDAEDGGVAHEQHNGPHSAIGYSEVALASIVGDAGFSGITAIHYGYWRMVPGTTFQDIVVLKKEEPLPTDFEPGRYLDLNPDLASGRTNPTFHYWAFGRREGRRYR